MYDAKGVREAASGNSHEKFCRKTLRWEWREGVIELTLDHEPANEIGTSMLAELEQFVHCIRRVCLGDSVCIISSARKSVFSAGADLRELYRGAAPLPEKERLQVFVISWNASMQY